MRLRPVSWKNTLTKLRLTLTSAEPNRLRERRTRLETLEGRDLLHTAPVLVHVPQTDYLSRTVTSATNVGMPIASLVSGETLDPTGAPGIAIIGTDTAQGTLQYSANSGSTWTNIGTVSASSALLLPTVDSSGNQYELRLNPSGSSPLSLFNVTDAITFRAWDQTTGTIGGTGNTTTNGGTTAYSTATDTIAFATNPAPVGSIASTSTSTKTDFPAVTSSDSSGNYVIAYTSGTNVYGQRYSIGGTAVGSQFQINPSGNSDYSFRPAIGMAPGGQFVSAWYGSVSGTAGVYAQMYNSNGTTNGSAFKVNPSGSHVSAWGALSVGVSSTGSFAIEWYGTDSSGANTGVYTQLYSSSGSASGSPIAINVGGTEPSMAMASNGSFVASWLSSGNVYAEQFSSSGSAVGSSFVVSTSASITPIYPRVSVGVNGQFAVAWQKSSYTGSTGAVWARSYTSSGSSVESSPILVDTNTADYTSYGFGNADLAVDGAGDFLVGWIRANSNPYGALGQYYNSSGSANGTPFWIDQTSASGTYGYGGAAVASDSSGDFTVAWGHVVGTGGPQQYQIDSESFATNAAPQTTSTALSLSMPNSVPATLDVSPGFTDVNSPSRDHLTYTVVGDDNPSLFSSLSFSGSVLTLSPVSTASGTAHLTVQATDLSGLSITNTVTVTQTVGTSVSIQAVDNQAFTPTSSSGSGDTGQFVVTRSSLNISSALTVNYTVGGSATAGTDYTALSGSVTIAAGQTSATVNVQPLYRSTSSYGDRNVTLTISSSSSYAIGTSADTVTIDDTGSNSAGPSPLTNGSLVLTGLPGGLNYVSSAADPNPIFSADELLQTSNGSGSLTGITVTGSLGGISAPTEYFSATGANTTSLFRFADQISAGSLASGRYTWQLTVTENYSSGSPVTNTFVGQEDVLNRTGSPFGMGWDASFLDHLAIGTNGIEVFRGDGSQAYFWSTGSGTYQSTPGDPYFSTLSTTGSTYSLTSNIGTTETFNSSGQLTSKTDRNGNVTTFTYSSGKLVSMTDGSNHSTSFGYTGSLITSITDFAGRVITLAYNGSNQLTSITQPIPSTGASAPVTTFGYSSSSFLTSEENPDGSSTTNTFSYNYANALGSVTTPGSEVTSCVAVQVAALPNLGVHGSTSANPTALVTSASVVATSTDALSNSTTYSMNVFGQPLLVTNALGYTTTFTRNDSGLATSVSQEVSVGQYLTTSCQYDSLGNVTQKTTPDGASQTWTYTSKSTAGGPYEAPTSYVDGLGRTTNYTLDSNGNILTQTQVGTSGTGGTGSPLTTYTYTPLVSGSGNPPAGLVATMTNALSQETTYTYNSHGLLTQEITAYGTSVAETQSFTYDSNDNPATATDPLSNVTTYVYDNLNRLTSVTQPADSSGTHPVTSHTYDAVGQLLTTTDPLSRATTNTYDGNGNLTQVATPNPTGSSTPVDTNYTYTADNQVASMSDPRSNVTNYTYDVTGQLTTVTQPAPNSAYPTVRPVTSYTYDGAGRLLSTTSPLYQTTSYSYAYGTYTYNSIAYPNTLTVTTSLPSGHSISAVYDADNEDIFETDALSNTTQYKFDQLGRPAQQPDPSNTSILLGPAYDLLGNMVSNTDLLGNVTTYAYDAKNRLTSMTQPAASGTGSGGVTSYAYNADNELTSQTDPLSNVTSYTYDHLGRELTVSQPVAATGVTGGPTTTYTYDLVGNVLTETDPLTNETVNTYGQTNNLLTSTVAYGTSAAATTTYTYDAAGNLLTLEDPDGNTTTYTYDGLNRQITAVDSASNTTSYQYNLGSQLTQLVDPDSRVTNYYYDAMGNNTQQTWQNSVGGAVTNTINYTYDSNNQLTGGNEQAAGASYYTANDTFTLSSTGNPTTITEQLAGLTPTVTLTQAFDFNNNRSSLKVSIGGTYDLQSTYQYDNLGRMTQVQQQGQGGNTVTNKLATFSYDSDGNLTGIGRQVDNGSGTLVSVASSAYTYDHDLNITGISHTAGSTTIDNLGWTYDAGSRVTSFTSSVDGTLNYGYDNASQLTGVTSGSTTVQSETYDANGNRTASSATTSNNRLTFDGTYYYSYDNAGNRTSKYQLSGSTHVNVTSYSYDNRNRLTGVTLPSGETIAYMYDAFNREISKTATLSGGSSSEQWCIYDGQNLLLTLNSSSGAVADRYLNGPLVDQVLTDENGSTNAVDWLLTDNLGTTRDVVINNPSTGMTTTLDHIVYDAFGNITAQTSSSAQPQFLFTGQRYDADSGLYYDQARWYDPATARFITMDPVAFGGGDSNLFRYVGNAVTNAVDPNGLEREPPPGPINWGQAPANPGGAVGLQTHPGSGGGSGGGTVNPYRPGTPGAKLWDFFHPPLPPLPNKLPYKLPNLPELPYTDPIIDVINNSPLPPNWKNYWTSPPPKAPPYGFKWWLNGDGTWMLMPVIGTPLEDTTLPGDDPSGLHGFYPSTPNPEEPIAE